MSVEEKSIGKMDITLLLPLINPSINSLILIIMKRMISKILFVAALLFLIGMTTTYIISVVIREIVLLDISMILLLGGMVSGILSAELDS